MSNSEAVLRVPIALNLIVVAILAIMNTVQVARVARSESRIIEGVNVTPANKYPMIVAVVDPSTGDVRCMGTILNSNLVLTSARCAQEVYQKNKTGVLYEVLAGINNLREPDARYVQKLSIIFTELHHLYNFVTAGLYGNNIGTLTVDGFFVWNDYVSPTNLPKPSWNVLPNEEIRAIPVEWNLGMNYPSLPLREFELPLVTTEECQRGWVIQLVTDDHLCMKPSEQAGACAGDPGAPLFIYNEADDKHIQIGIHSWEGTRCPAPNATADALMVFTKVSKYIQWIRGVQRICSNSSCEETQ